MSVLEHALVHGGWTTIPFGRLTQRSKESGRPDLPPLSVFLGDGVVPRSSREDNHNRLGADMSNYLVVRPGDIVFNKLRTWQGGLGVSRFEGVVSPAYFVCRPRSATDSRYYHYLLRSSPYLAELTRISKFMPPSQFDISWDDLSALRVPKPPLEEQRAIADYLDAEIARIDALIAKKQQLIRLLEERLAAEISQRLGSPSCESVPLRRVCSRLVDGTHGTYARLDSGWPLLSAKNLKNGIVHQSNAESFISESDYRDITRSRQFEAGAILLGVIGGSIGNAARLRPGDPLAFQRSVAALMPNQLTSTDYLWFVVRSEYFQEELQLASNSAAQAGVYLGDLGEIPVPLMTAVLQKLTVRALLKEEARVSQASGLLSDQILLLAERRQALITAAVTGEFRVPGAA